jgi:hypothetical protein
MMIILLIVLMSVGKKRMTRRRRKRRGATRKTSITRRPIMRHTLARNGTPMMRVPTPIVILWPP